MAAVVMEVNSTYNFNTLAPSILQAAGTGMTLIGTVNYAIANTMINVSVQQRSIYPELPAGTPSDETTYKYYVFKDINGKQVVLADAWIDQNSIVKVSMVTINISIGQCTSADMTVLQNQLNLLGYKGRFSITSTTSS